MHLSALLLFMSLGSLVKWAAGSEWCYSGCEHTPAHWTDITGSFCGGKRQSPVNIITAAVLADEKLKNFTFTGFSSEQALKTITNNGHTVKLELEDGVVEVSGGGLNGTYSTIQFHFHWGDTEYHPGSEHTVNGHRYPMEMHIVSLKKGLSVAEAKKDPEGIAVLGFFINATENGDTTGPWSNITSYVTKTTGAKVNVTDSISINHLIGDVDTTKFYRYMGSLTTPTCDEAVVWTVFHEPIMVHKDLIKMFPNKTALSNVYRPQQSLNGRHVYASPGTPLPSHPWCYDSHCDHSPSMWHSLPNSHCGGQSQSPVNIDTKTTVDKQLESFKFTKFDDKHAIKYITNTGHAVKCVLEDNRVEVSGGSLGHDYSTLQFHLHWGSTSDNSEGSEHAVDSRRYPMEMHIVSKRKDLTLDQATATSNGLAVLGFFLQASDSKSGGGSGHEEEKPPMKPANNKEAWEKLTKYLLSIQAIGSKTDFKDELSIDDLLGDVSRKKYYRYNGSLTTPSCNEAVVWTVFKQPITVDKDMMKLFPTMMGYQNVFRPRQALNNRTIISTDSVSGVYGPHVLFLLLACLCAYYL